VRAGKHWSCLDHQGQRPKTQTLFFKFPQPEHYRNWRIRAEDAVIAASSKPDLTFHWTGEVFRTDLAIEALKDSGRFVTLDAKLMSSFTNVYAADLLPDNWTPSRTPARCRHHTCSSSHTGRAARTAEREVCGGGFAGCPPQQRASLPRTRCQWPLPFSRFGL
jgi:hypothetical protein